MRCPKCGYISFDHLTECRKCGANLEEVRRRLNLPDFDPLVPYFLAVDREEIPVEMTQPMDLGADIGPSPHAAARPAADGSLGGIGTLAASGMPEEGEAAKKREAGEGTPSKEEEEEIVIDLGDDLEVIELNDEDAAPQERAAVDRSSDQFAPAEALESDDFQIEFSDDDLQLELTEEEMHKILMELQENDEQSPQDDTSGEKDRN